MGRSSAPGAVEPSSSRPPSRNRRPRTNRSFSERSAATGSRCGQSSGSTSRSCKAPRSTSPQDPKGVGKGTWLARKIADTTRGRLGPKRNVLIVSSEDSASIDLKPRLVAADADHTRWHLVVEELMLPRDLYRLEALAARVGDVGLIVLDPVGNHLGGVDTDKEGLVRYAIGGLNKLADDLACMIVGVRHLAKPRVHGALAAVLGSTAWVDVPRAVLAFARDDEDEMVFHVQVVAGNRSGVHRRPRLPDRAPRGRAERADHLRRGNRGVAQERRRPPRRATPRVEVG